MNTFTLFHIRTLIVIPAIGFLFVGASPAKPELDELTLPPVNAFAIGTDVNIRSVLEMETDSFNVLLANAHDCAEPWADDFVMIALRFLGRELRGSVQNIQVHVEPSEWEEGRPLKFARVTIEDSGWLDDSVSGERYVLWLRRDDHGRLLVHRALWAELCWRMYWRFYSADSCP